jgi:hypothetical protein
MTAPETLHQPVREPAALHTQLFRSTLAAAVICAGWLTMTAPAAAQAACLNMMTGKGRSSTVLGSADYTLYQGRVPRDLARKRAIEDWQAKTSLRCPRLSPSWLRASIKKMQCEGSVGHTDCTARARPARRLLGR